LASPGSSVSRPIRPKSRKGPKKIRPCATKRNMIWRTKPRAWTARLGNAVRASNVPRWKIVVRTKK